MAHNVTVRGRMRRRWAVKVAAILMALGVRVLRLTRTEWSLDGKTWASLGEFKVAIDVSLAKP